MKIKESPDKNWWECYNELHPNNYSFLIKNRKYSKKGFSSEEAEEIGNQLVINSQEVKFWDKGDKEMLIKMNSGIELYALIDKNGNISRPNKIRELDKNIK